MRQEQLEMLASSSDSELDALVRRSTDGGTATLTHLLWALDARRRSRESLAIEQTAQAWMRRG